MKSKITLNKRWEIETLVIGDIESHSSPDQKAERTKKLPIISSEIHLQDDIGQGSFGKLVKGMMDGKPVAVKKPIFAEKDPLLMEGELLIGFEHRNIVTCYGVDKESNLIMEYMDCGDVLNFIKEVKQDWDASLAIALQTALGLEYIHQQGFVHLDFKSKNILINSDGEVKICDFGTAVKEGTITGETLQNVGGGTLLYQPPEMYFKDKSKSLISFSYDIYSFGTFLGELIVRDHPQLKGSNLRVIKENMQEKNQIHRSLSISKLEVSGVSKEDKILETLRSLHHECRNIDAAKRLKIEDIVKKLQGLVNEYRLNVSGILKNAFSQSLKQNVYIQKDEDQGGQSQNGLDDKVVNEPLINSSLASFRDQWVQELKDSKNTAHGNKIANSNWTNPFALFNVWPIKTVSGILNNALSQYCSLLEYSNPLEPIKQADKIMGGADPQSEKDYLEGPTQSGFY